MSHRAKGMTLIELIVVVAVVAILASIALPSHRSYILRANRTEVRAALLALAAAQEKFYLQCNTFTSALDEADATDCGTGNLRFQTTTERGHYRINVSTADDSAWAAEATPSINSRQLDDVACRWFGFASSGAKSAKSSNNVDTTGECWGR